MMWGSERAMIQCQDCQYFHRNNRGDIRLECDPFSTIVEPECLTKWQLVKINQMTASVNQMVASYQATLDYYRKLAPMQEKMFKVMERELDDMSESENWKTSEDGDDEPEDDDPSGGESWGQGKL